MIGEDKRGLPPEGGGAGPGGTTPGGPPAPGGEPSPPDPPGPRDQHSTDHGVACELAAEAGRRLLELRAGGGEPELLRKAGDRLSHEFLVASLAACRPGDVILSEEGADDPARLAASRVWIVDPLDGTTEFGEPGRSDWAVHVALWERGEAGGEGELTAGAVALPAQDRILCTTAAAGPPGGETSTAEPSGGGWSTAGPPDGGEGTGRVRIVVSRSRAPRLVYGISDLLDAELVPWGSAGAKVAAVVYGEADAYVHAGGFYEWDTAAPVAVARAAGFHASRIDGSPLAYNQADLRMPDILVCRPALAGALLQAIREVTNAP
jgi:3'(2'), 5'-bisphosphate nucleotidase